MVASEGRKPRRGWLRLVQPSIGAFVVAVRFSELRSFPSTRATHRDPHTRRDMQTQPQMPASPEVFYDVDLQALIDLLLQKQPLLAQAHPAYARECAWSHALGSPMYLTLWDATGSRVSTRGPSTGREQPSALWRGLPRPGLRLCRPPPPRRRRHAHGRAATAAARSSTNRSGSTWTR